MKNMKKCYFVLIVISIIMTILLHSNQVFSAESWKEFYLRFKFESSSAEGNVDKLSDADLTRILEGPTKEERLDGAIDDAADLKATQEIARQIKEARVQSGKWRK